MAKLPAKLFTIHLLALSNLSLFLSKAKSLRHSSLVVSIAILILLATIGWIIYFTAVSTANAISLRISFSGKCSMILLLTITLSGSVFIKLCSGISISSGRLADSLMLKSPLLYNIFLLDKTLLLGNS